MSLQRCITPLGSTRTAWSTTSRTGPTRSCRVRPRSLASWCEGDLESLVEHASRVLAIPSTRDACSTVSIQPAGQEPQGEAGRYNREGIDRRIELPLPAAFLILDQPVRPLAVPIPFLVLGAEVLSLRHSPRGGDHVEVVERVRRVLKFELAGDPVPSFLDRRAGNLVG